MQFFKNLKLRLHEFRARRRIAAYEKRYMKDFPLEQRPDPVDVEATFDVFVEQFGGLKISDLFEDKREMPMNADYLFREQNVIAELKTLEGIFAGADAPIQLIQAYKDAGYTSGDLENLLWRGEPMPEKVRVLIGKRIRRSLEKRIVKARKQLRQSKLHFGNDETRTLLLVAMDQPPLFGHSFMLATIAKIMDDNYSDADTDGIVYFNPNMPTKTQETGMEFSGWYPFYRNDDENKRLSKFVDLLGNRWLTFYGEKIGQTNPILTLKSPEEMYAILRGP